MKVILFLIIGMIMISIGYYFVSVQKNYSREYFENFQSSFSGKVISVNELGRYDVVKLDRISSDVDCYDPSDTLKSFFCKINNNTIEVVISSTYISDSDIVTFDGKNNTITIIKENENDEKLKGYVSPYFIFSISNSDFSIQGCD